jgi:hypothetical protein
MRVRDESNTHIVPFTVADPENQYGDGGLTDGVALDGSPTAGFVTVGSGYSAFGYHDISVISIKFSSCWLFNAVTNFTLIISKLKWFKF